jgi:hypothetical protein
MFLLGCIAKEKIFLTIRTANLIIFRNRRVQENVINMTISSFYQTQISGAILKNLYSKLIE